MEVAKPVPPFAVPSVPVTSAPAKLTAELVTACVDPAKWAMPTPGDEEVTHVAQAIVLSAERAPPPVIGEVVFTLRAVSVEACEEIEVTVPADPEVLPVTLPVILPEKVPVVVPSRVGFDGIEIVIAPVAPDTVI